METMSFKALAMQVLQGNRGGNFQEKGGFLAGQLHRKTEEIPPELAAWDGTFPTDVHRRAFPVSITRPGNLAKLAPEPLDLWQGVVAACIYYQGRQINEAEGFAWAFIDQYFPST